MVTMFSQHTLIAVIGVTGAGKTTFISKATDRADLEIGHGIDSTTQEVQPVQFRLDGRPVVLIDTPGFDDTERDDTDILELIANFLSTTHEKDLHLAGLILLQPINDNRLKGTEKKRTRLFKKLLGENAYERCIIATTMWDQVSDAVGKARSLERQNRKDVWGDMMDKGATCVPHDNTKESALKIVRKVMEFPDPVILQIQKELEANGGKVGQTSAGRQLDSDLSDEVKRLNEKIEKLREEKVQAEEEVRELYKKVADMEKQQSKLKEKKVKPMDDIENIK